MNEIKKLLLNQGATKTVEGVPPLTLERSLGKDLKDYKIYGKSQQGKNLLDIESMLIASNWRQDSSLNVSGYWNYPIKGLKPNTTYTLSMKENGWNGVSNNTLYVTLRNNVGTFSENGALCHDTGDWYYCNTLVTIVSNQEGMLYLSFYNPTDERLALFFSKCPEIMLEEGSVATEYEIPSCYVSPEKPIEIESVGDKTVNLADLSKATNGHFVDNGDGSYTLTKVDNSNRFSEELYPVIPANTTFYIKAKILEYTGTYSQKLQLLVHLEDGSTKYINNAVDDIQGKYTYTSAVKDIRIYSDASNPNGAYVTFKDFIISTEDVSYEPYDKYKIPIISRSKNLFDKYKWFPEFIDDDGNIHYTNTDYTKIYSRKILEGKFKKNTQYTFSVQYELIKKQECEYGVILHMALSDGTNVIKRLPDAKQVGTYTGECFVTNPIGTTVSKISLSYNNQNYSAEVVLWDVQIEEGAKATEYEHYAKPVKLNIYLDEPLRKVGNYADYIDFENGKVVRNVKETELTGSETWGLPSYVLGGYSSYRIVNFFEKIPVENFLCNYFPTMPEKIYYDYVQNVATSFPVTTQLIINVSNDIADSNSQTSSTNWKNWLLNQKNNGTPVKIYHIINPVEESIELPKIPTHKGTTIIELDTKINASNMMTKYKRR